VSIFSTQLAIGLLSSQKNVLVYASVILQLISIVPGAEVLLTFDLRILSGHKIISIMSLCYINSIAMTKLKKSEIQGLGSIL
jgi:hypothetical protein